MCFSYKSDNENVNLKNKWISYESQNLFVLMQN